MKKISSHVLLLLLSMFLLTCNKKKEDPCIHDEAALYVTVIDNNGVKIGSATINVFDSENKFELAKSNGNDSASATFSTMSSVGIEAELMVNPYEEQWMLVTYYDTTQQKFLSSANNFGILDPLQSCSDYHITVKLDQVGGIVAFWASTSQNIPIAVKFNNVVDTLSSSSPLAPTSPANSFSLNYPVAAGTYQYQASTPNGCTWQGEVTVADGQFTSVELAPCQRAVVAFYYNTASSIPTSKKTITVFIDNNPNPVGTVTSEFTGTLVNSCDLPAQPNVFYVYLEPGTSHTYKAQSAAGGSTSCVWTGTIPVVNANCALNTPIYFGTGCTP